MRAHGQRRIIWILDLALGAAVLAVVAWFVLDVRKAVARPEFLRPPFAVQAVDNFLSQQGTHQSALRPPVQEGELKEIDREEFKTRVGGPRFHWVYSGPMPPPRPEERPVEAARGPVESDLAKLGQVRMLMYVPPDPGQTVASGTVMYWEFKSGRKLAFNPGEWLDEPGATRGGSIKLVDVRPKNPGSRKYEIHYEVYEDPDGEPIKRDVYEYDGTIPLPQEIDERVRFPTGRGRGGETGGETSAPTRREPGVTTGDGPTSPAAPAPAVRRESLNPTVEWVDRNTARVEFDESTYEYFRGRNPDDLAKSVQTQPYSEGGRVIGLQITGISPETPADKFDVKPGDILVSINDQPVRSRSDAVNIAQNIDPNTERVKVVIDRRGRLITFNIDPRDPKTRRAARYLDNPPR